MSEAFSQRFQRGIFVLLLVSTVALSWWLYQLTQTGTDATAPPRSDLTAHESAVIERFHEASPSVVYITSLQRSRDRFTLNVMEIPRGTGSGFVWDSDGHVVTNHHVLANGNAWAVTLWDQSTWKAKLVGAFPDKDLAVLRIDAPIEQLSPIPVGRSADLLVGQSVLAIGNPFGFDHTLTTGVISGLGREIKASNGRPIQGVIQTDAAINPGNSGGPLLDSQGRLIGVNTALFSPTGAYAGVGFAVPADTVSRVVPKLIKYGRITRPGLGVAILPEPQMKRFGLDGVMIARVAAGSVAERAGLRAIREDVFGRIALGDIISAVDNEPVHNSDDLYKILETHKVGDTIVLTIIRDKATRSVKLPLQAVQ